MKTRLMTQKENQAKVERDASPCTSSGTVSEPPPWVNTLLLKIESMRTEIDALKKDRQSIGSEEDEDTTDGDDGSRDPQQVENTAATGNAGKEKGIPFRWE